jgi:hypothetical protein
LVYNARMAKVKTNDSVIKFKAQVWQVKTLVDGGINVTLALSENEIKQVSGLLECKRRGAILEVAAVPVFIKEINGKEKARPAKRKQRYPYR